MQGWSPVGIKDSLILWKQELGESHRGMCTWEQLSEERRGAPGRGLLSGLQNSLLAGLCGRAGPQEQGAGEGHPLLDCRVFAPPSQFNITLVPGCP